jgi:hypothetical protein
MFRAHAGRTVGKRARGAFPDRNYLEQGFQHHFSNARIAVGPEWNLLLYSDATDLINNSGAVVSAHNVMNLLFVIKWWF